jgi:enoyl-CoA hydratase/carnithine racemase
MGEAAGHGSVPGNDGVLVTSRVSWGRATITLDSPHNRNALSRRLVDQLTAHLERADADPQVRVVVLTHTGGTFCAGADLGESSEGALGDPVRERGEQLAGLLRRILTLGSSTATSAPAGWDWSERVTSSSPGPAPPSP